GRMKIAGKNCRGVTLTAPGPFKSSARVTGEPLVQTWTSLSLVLVSSRAMSTFGNGGSLFGSSRFWRAFLYSAGVMPPRSRSNVAFLATSLAVTGDFAAGLSLPSSPAWTAIGTRIINTKMAVLFMIVPPYLVPWSRDRLETTSNWLQEYTR